jgi:hypothetical protein
MSVGSKIAGVGSLARTANAALTGGLEKKIQSLDPAAVAAGGIPAIVLGILTAIFVIVTIVCSFEFETSANIARKAQLALKPYLPYGTKEGERNSMDKSLTKYASSTPKERLILTNFYIQTANVAGLLQSGNRSVASLDAVRFALLGGARAFVFDLWPDTEPGDAQHGPVLLTMEPGSMCRRTSYNSIPFVSVLSQLLYVAYQAKYNSTSNDPLIIYLRFRYPANKSGPRADTMEMTARSLQATIQPYRLDASFNKCRAQPTIPMLPLSVFARKVIVVSNTNGANTSLADYINIAPEGGIPVEMAKTFAVTVIPTGTAANTDGMRNAINTIKQNLTFVAPMGEDPDAFGNGWDIKGAQSLGVHCCAMNMDPSKLPPAVAKDFKDDSFILKPAALQYAPTRLPPPQAAPDFKFGSGATAGSIAAPSMASPF